MKHEVNDVKFYYFGKDVIFNGNFYTACPSKIYIGDSGIIGESVELCVSDNWCNVENEINLKINDHFFFNSRVKIEAGNYIEIGKYVTFGPETFISDICHEYRMPQLPVKLQGYININENKLIIKDGAWIGAGAKVVGNLTIGYGAVIGANAVVTKDIPDHSVAVGVPARVIKIFDYSKKTWVNVKNNDKLLQKILSSRGIFNGYDFDIIERKIENAGKIIEEPEIINEKIDKIVNVIVKIGEIINKIITLVEEQKYNESKDCLLDLTNNLDSIQSAIKRILNERDIELLTNEFVSLNQNLNDIITMYESNNNSSLIELFNNLLNIIDSLGKKLITCKK